jgi:hypothetical protein
VRSSKRVGRTNYKKVYNTKTPSIFMKKGLLILPLVTLLLINFVSAGIISDTLNIIGLEDLFLVIIFLISFTLSYLALSRVFRKGGGAAGILAFLVALGITAGISFSDFNVPNLFYDFGIDEGILWPIALILLLAGIGFFIYTYSFATLLMIMGILIFALSWISYEEDIMKWLGGGLFIIGAFLWWRKKPRTPRDPSSPPKEPGFFKRKTGRDIPIKRAEKEAYKENAKRDAWQKKVDENEAYKENAKRDAIDRKKYKNLMKENKRLFKRNKKIPKLETSDGRKRQKNIEKMKKIESKVKRL